MILIRYAISTEDLGPLVLETGYQEKTRSAEEVASLYLTEHYFPLEYPQVRAGMLIG